MGATRFELLQTLFDRLRDTPVEDQRERIDREGLDPTLRQELEQLLRMHRELEAAPPREPMPERIGPYHILGVLGHGGMGTVYRAEQLEPVRRLLAIKVVQAGLGTKEVLARFHVERRALAAMNHRHIAKVFDAGATEHGQPYFAMELVDGLPLGEYCDRHRLSLPQRLILFRQICDGVQHAHQKGVVHRDLKPGNVLVTTEGDEPVPKIVDFGLAKATDRDFVDVSLRTEKDQILGTFEYMSPEQAHGDSELVDARSDIYSLGVMLYELLCGELPFPTDELRRSGRLEALRMIRELEPVRPSAKLLARADRAAVAELRQTSVAALHRSLRGDLDWVVLAAMAKEPERRYAAATLLAADLQRHLDFEPVLASPPSLGYRLRKFVRRYRVQCGAAAVVGIAVVVGGIGTWRGLAAERAESERNRVFADAALLAEARAEETALHPAWPEQLPALRRWLELYGEPLASHFARLSESLARLRSRAASRTPSPSDAEADTRKRRELVLALEHEDAEPRRAELADQIRLLDTDAEIRGYAFADGNDAFVHRTLSQLVRDLREFTAPEGLLADVRDRCARAAAVHDLTIAAPHADWAAAIAAIAASDGVRASTSYDHLAITPQIGLVPLGMDPESKLWEFVHLASGTPGRERPVREPATQRLRVTDDTGIVFVLVPGGSLPAAADRPSVAAASAIEPFFVSKYELTMGQMLRLTRRREAAREATNLTLPAVSISWFDCRDMLVREGCTLPSERAWEYACRGGTDGSWWTGRDPQSLAGKESPRNAEQLLPVGSLAQNPFGLFDTLGNAAEWCRDEHTEMASPGGPSSQGSAGPIADVRSAHRGSLDINPKNPSDPVNLGCSTFEGLSPSFRILTLGVRPARDLRP